MTVIEQTRIAPFNEVAVNIYGNIHKAIRAELFRLTTTSGRIDPADRGARVATAADLNHLMDLLVSHAEHEDAALQPAIVTHLPDLAERIENEHATLETRMDGLRGLAGDNVDAPRSEQRHTAYRLYVELASFTSAYLAHQDVEERLVMPALESAVGVEGAFALHEKILGSIPPAEMAEGLGLMLPVMNVEERVEMLGGMQENAPAEVFAGVWGLAGSVLTASDYAAVAARLGITE
jgi:hypothetical protein